MFAFGKSPLGTIIRFTRRGVIALAKAIEEADEVASKLKAVGINVRIVDVKSIEGVYEAAYIDPDIVDVGYRYVVLAEWI